MGRLQETERIRLVESVKGQGDVEQQTRLASDRNFAMVLQKGLSQRTAESPDTMGLPDQIDSFLAEVSKSLL